MIYPPMASLLDKVDSRYTLVIVIAKRARMLTNGAQKLTEVNSEKDVTLAINEIAENKITYHKVKKQQPTYENMVEASLNSIEDQV
ncbi:MAG: DNA-directed RNA polymerase subunit omega [Clostridiaceae bacterium]|jgi:DNA-directed RNA polymerase subunit omega|nr:DNA-directed RNA polymerase subunit omega [Clostridiaceae bacterium]